MLGTLVSSKLNEYTAHNSFNKWENVSSVLHKTMNVLAFCMDKQIIHRFIQGSVIRNGSKTDLIQLILTNMEL